VRDGALPSRSENGFTFVDIDKSAATPSTNAIGATKEPHPPTFRELTEEELQALHSADGNDEALLATPGCMWEGVHWRDARKRVQRTRRPPAATGPSGHG
jgi:hypothetical protein